MSDADTEVARVTDSLDAILAAVRAADPDAHADVMVSALALLWVGRTMRKVGWSTLSDWALALLDAGQKQGAMLADEREPGSLEPTAELVVAEARIGGVVIRLVKIGDEPMVVDVAGVVFRKVEDLRGLSHMLATYSHLLEAGLGLHGR